MIIKDVEIISQKGKVLIKINRYEELGFEPIKNITCDNDQPEVNGITWVGSIKGIRFVNNQATVTLVDWLKLLPVFTSRGMSIWQASTRLA